MRYTVEVMPGGTFWRKEGTDVLHREDGPAYNDCYGTKRWYFNGKLHREDGPAIEWADGEREWYINGELRRDDGPAIEMPHGAERQHWHVNNEKLTEQQFLDRTSPIKELTVAEIEQLLGCRVKVVR